MDSLNVEVNLWWQQSSQDIGIELQVNISGRNDMLEFDDLNV